MSTYFDDAQKLVEHTRITLTEIEQLTQQSASSAEVDVKLLVEIKHILEDLRSILDYTAHGLADKHGAYPKNLKTLQFPYSPPLEGQEWFEKEVERRLPGLMAKRPDIVDKLASYQHFNNRFGDFISWLPMLMELTNEKKHRELSAHHFKTMLLQEYEVSIPPNATIEIPWPLVNDGPGKLTTTQQKLLMFKHQNVAVVMFLRCAVSQVERITNELSTL